MNEWVAQDTSPKRRHLRGQFNLIHTFYPFIVKILNILQFIPTSAQQYPTISFPTKVSYRVRICLQ